MGKKNEVLFVDALRRLSAESGNLSSVVAVDGLLRVLTTEVRSAFIDGRDAAEVAEAAVIKATDALLGRGGSDTVADWNSPERLGKYVMSMVGGETPIAAVQAALMRFLAEYVQILEYAGQDGVLEEQWDFQMVEVYERYTRLFLGIPEPIEGVL